MKFVKQRYDFEGVSSPGKLARTLLASLDQVCPEEWVIVQVVNSRGHLLGVAGIVHQGGSARDLRNAGCVTGDDGTAGRHRFDDWQCEAFEDGWIQEGHSIAVERW